MARLAIIPDGTREDKRFRRRWRTCSGRKTGSLTERGEFWGPAPPLFKVTQKKQVRYVQTIEAMSQELIGRGLTGTKLDVLAIEPDGAAVSARPAMQFESERLAQLAGVLSKLEESLLIFERRNMSLPTLLAKATTGTLPSFRVLLQGQEYWLTNAPELDAFP